MINLTINRTYSWLILLTIGLTLAGNVNASDDSIGKVILSVGKVSAQDASGALRQLKRRGKIFEGDILTTDAGARCQIRFSDGSLVALPESSQFRVDEYSYDGTEGKEKAIYSLLKGGMRTITGAIGKKTKENYKVNTPVATIGIRGTAYHAFLYRLPSGEVQLYGGVQYGMITVDNEAGSALFGTNQNFRVLSSQEQAQILLTLPDFYPSQSEEDPDGGNDGNSDDDIGENDFNDEDSSIIVEESDPAPVAQLRDDSLLDSDLQGTEDVDGVSPVSSQLAPSGSMVAIAFTGSTTTDGLTATSASILNVDSNELYIDTVDGVRNIPVGAIAYDAHCNPCSFVPGTATLADTGGDAIGVNWGRWDGDYIVMENDALTQTSGSFHYIYTPNVTPLSVVKARTGYASYTLSGGTAPTDQAGNIGTLDYLDIYVDFDLQNIDSAYLGATVDTVTFSATSTESVAIVDAISPGGGIDMFDSKAGLDGRIDLNFVGSNAEAIAASYGFYDSTLPSGTSITGTALLTETAGEITPAITY